MVWLVSRGPRSAAQLTNATRSPNAPNPGVVGSDGPAALSVPAALADTSDVVPVVRSRT
jgi:hypothetical protein